MLDVNRPDRKVFLSDEYEYEIGVFGEYVIRLFQMSNGDKLICAIHKDKMSSANKDEVYKCIGKIEARGFLTFSVPDYVSDEYTRSRFIKND